MTEQRHSAMPGFRSFARTVADQPDVLEQLTDLSPADLSDAQFGSGAMDGRLRPVSVQSGCFTGAALTVSVTPGNGLMIRKALDYARPGDLLVINAFGNRERAVFGANVARNILSVGIRAVVVDGVIRDAGDIAEIGLPVFARGTTPRAGSDANGRGEINVPVACGGVVVAPNDVVVADCQDGIAVLPGDEWQFVVDRARALLRARSGAGAGADAPAPAGLPPKDALEQTLFSAGFRTVDRSWVADRSAHEAARGSE